MSTQAVVLLNNPEGRKMVEKACQEKDLAFAEFKDLVQEIVEQMGKQRRAGLWESFDDILDRIIVEE